MKRKRKFRYPHERKRRAKRLRIALAIIAIALIAGVIYLKLDRQDNRDTAEAAALDNKVVPLTFDTPEVKFDGNYGGTFNDLQDIQIVAAEQFGIEPMEGNAKVGQHIKAQTLVPIESNDYYDCLADNPYLTPNAAQLLDEIARRYHALEGDKPLRLTSCLRTRTSLAKLKKVNKLAVDNSCHLYGTTFDISYSQMTRAEKRSLAQVLHELQSGGHCYVKYERKQPCFHITSRH